MPSVRTEISEIVTGLALFALEVFEQDMVGVKGYDATILELLTRHNVRIVSKVSNANTITHYVDTSMKVLRRVEKDLAARYPSADISSRAIAMASVIGRDLSGLSVLFHRTKRAIVSTTRVVDTRHSLIHSFVESRHSSCNS